MKAGRGGAGREVGRMIVVGIDPGLAGAIACIGCDEPWSVNMPVVKTGKRRRLDEAEIHGMFDALRMKYGDYGVAIEKAQTMPGEGPVGAFSYGEGYGWIRGLLAGMGISCTPVHPRTWKKEMLRDMPDTGKGSAKLVAARLFPGVGLGRTRILTADRAEALLIAEWLRRRLSGS